MGCQAYNAMVAKLYHDRLANIEKFNPVWMLGRPEPVMPPPKSKGEASEEKTAGADIVEA